MIAIPLRPRKININGANCYCSLMIVIFATKIAHPELHPCTRKCPARLESFMIEIKAKVMT